MKLLAQLSHQLQALDERSLIRRRRTVDTPCGPRVTVDGRELLAFCSNDYLGLANHPVLVEALREGAARYGAGSGASHLISGHARPHALLEDRLADFVGAHLEQPRALTFCTGYMANLAIISGLTAGDRDAEIFSESLNHASLIDGARLSRTRVQVYPHADLAALEAMLKASNATTRLVVTDSVFSMDGDLAPLPELLALCEQHNAWLVVDDAHGFGMLGARGHGALEHFDLHSPYLVYMGTLGKAAGGGEDIRTGFLHQRVDYRLVGSEMCIRDSGHPGQSGRHRWRLCRRPPDGNRHAGTKSPPVYLHHLSLIHI